MTPSHTSIPSVTVFVPVKASERLPQLSGEFAVTMSHENDYPDEPYTQDFVEYIFGEGWDTTKGWKIFEWLEQKQTADIDYIKEILNDMTRDDRTILNEIRRYVGGF